MALKFYDLPTGHMASRKSVKGICSIITYLGPNENHIMISLSKRSKDNHIIFTARGNQRGGSQVNWKNGKYAYAVDVLIHQFTHVEFSNGTLPIHLNF